MEPGRFALICRLTALNPAALAAAEPHRLSPPYRLQPYTLSESFFTSVLPRDLPGCHAPGCLLARHRMYTRGHCPYCRAAAGCAFDAYISPLPPWWRVWKRSIEYGYLDGALGAGYRRGAQTVDKTLKMHIIKVERLV